MRADSGEVNADCMHQIGAVLLTDICVHSVRVLRPLRKLVGVQGKLLLQRCHVLGILIEEDLGKHELFHRLTRHRSRVRAYSAIGSPEAIEFLLC